MRNLENRVIKSINSPGIYFIEHIDSKTLSSLKNKLEKTIIAVLNYNDKQLAIEVKGRKADEQELVNTLTPFMVIRGRINDKDSDFILDSEKFLRHLFSKNSDLSQRYIILIDINVLNLPLRGDDGSLINLQIV